MKENYAVKILTQAMERETLLQVTELKNSKAPVVSTYEKNIEQLSDALSLLSLSAADTRPVRRQEQREIMGRDFI